MDYSAMREKETLLGQLAHEKHVRHEAERYLDIAHNISRALIESATFEEISPKILEILCTSLHFPLGAVWVVDETRPVLRCTNVWNTDDTAELPALKEFARISKTFFFTVGKGLPGRVWQNKSVYYIKDVVTDPNFPRAHWALKSNLHHAMGLPLFFEKEFVGVIEFFMSNAVTFRGYLKNTLTDISNQLGIFIGREKAQQKVFEGLKSIKTIGALISEFKKAKEEAESADKLKSAFVANMSHELRTPLNAILGYSEMMEEDAKESGQKEYADNLNKVIDAGKHLLCLINNVLDLSKLEAGKIELLLEDINIAQMAKELTVLALPLVEKNHNRFKLIISPELDKMHTDGVRVRQAILNLISNAGKFTENGDISLEITPVHQAQEEWVQFIVTDTGVGIRAEKLEQLFQVFFQIDASTTRKYGGTGLGLFLTRQFCEILGGWVTVKSTEHKGSVFSITLPLKSTTGIEKTDFITPAATDNILSEQPDKAVLIIDDDLKLHKEIQYHLKEAGFTAYHAFNGEEGLKLAKKFNPSAIILDVIMPVMDGWSMLSAIKSDPQIANIPVILMSVTSEENLGFALGAIDYLHKPVNTETLIHKIRHLPSHGSDKIFI